MKSKLKTIPESPELLNNKVIAQQQEIVLQQAEIARQKEIIEQLQEFIRLGKHKQFGASSEKHTDQLNLFDEAELAVSAEDNTSTEETEITVPAHTRKKSGRKPLPEHLPRVRIIHDLAEDDKFCDCCGSKELHTIGEETAEQLDIIPAKAQVLVHVRPKYGCRNCEGSIKVAPVPKHPIPKSIASPGLLAHIITSKYQDALPLYRQETTLKRAGIEIPRSTLANWMVRSGELVQPIINLLRDKLLEAPLLHCDETPVQVLKEPDKRAQSKSYMWVQVAGIATGTPIRLFDYEPSRSSEVPLRLLEGFKGYLQTDGYAGYNKIAKKSGITSQGCWVHARRKFDETIKAQGKQSKTGKAQIALNHIGRLYRIEREIKDLSTQERWEIRQQKSQPIIEDLRKWLDKAIINSLPKSLLGKALFYLNSQWDKLIVYLEDGRLRMDNNLAENAIRPFVIGRRNWLFSNSQAGARSSANLYSLVETARANKLEPYAYLRVLMEELPKFSSVEDLEELLPWNIKI